MTKEEREILGQARNSLQGLAERLRRLIKKVEAEGERELQENLQGLLTEAEEKIEKVNGMLG